MRNEYKQWVNDAINNNDYARESRWTESVAIGNRQFVENTKVKLGLKAHIRKVVDNNDKNRYRTLKSEFPDSL